MRVKHCAYGHSVPTLLNPRGVTTVSHKYSVTVATHAAVVMAVPSTAHYPGNYKIKLYYLTLSELFILIIYYKWRKVLSYETWCYYNASFCKRKHLRKV
jgi:hypothetical protein